MRVNYNFSDDFGRYDSEAEVSAAGKVQIVNVHDEYGTEIELSDFSEDELNQICYLGRRAAEELDSMKDESDDEDLSDY